MRAAGIFHALVFYEKNIPICLTAQKVNLRYGVKSVVGEENFIERVLHTGLNHDYPLGLENRFD